MQHNSVKAIQSLHHDEEGEGEEGWLTSYADLITLLLAVFVMLFSMSTLDKDKMKELSNAMSNYITKKETTTAAKEDVTAIERQAEGMRLLSIMLDLGNTDDVLSRILKIQGDAAERRKLKELSDKLGIAGNGNFATVKPQFDFVFPDSMLFDSGSNELSNLAKQKLARLMPKLREVLHKPNAILQIEGHTDAGRPRSTNIELSVQRANAVFRYLLSNGVSETRMRVVGKGSTEPFVARNGHSNTAMNRRVVISVTSVR